MGDEQLSYREALGASLGDLSCPILVDMDIGHTPPQLTLVQGALATLKWAQSTGGELMQSLR